MSGLDILSQTQTIRTTPLKVQVKAPKHPRWSEFHLAVRTLLVHGDLAQAEHLVRDLLKVDSGDVLALKELADIGRARGELVLSETALRALVDRAPSCEHYFELASCLYDQSQDQEALKYYFLALRGLPTSPIMLFEIYKNIGNIFVRSHDFESAEDNYNKAYTLNPHSPLLFVNFGTLEIQRNRWSEAGERFRQALEVHPLEDRAWVGLALVHRQHGDLDLSWAALDRALDIRPQNETAVQLGLSWVAQDQRWRELIPRVVSFLSIHSEHIEMSFALAQLFYIVGEPDLCRLELERCLSLSPGHNEAAHLLLMADGEIGRRRERWG